jgi:hypothetical protein
MAVIDTLKLARALRDKGGFSQGGDIVLDRIEDSGGDMFGGVASDAALLQCARQGEAIGHRLFPSFEVLRNPDSINLRIASDSVLIRLANRKSSISATNL